MSLEKVYIEIIKAKIKKVKTAKSYSVIYVNSYLYNIKIVEINKNEIYFTSNTYLGLFYKFLFKDSYKKYKNEIESIKKILQLNNFNILNIKYYPS